MPGDASAEHEIMFADVRHHSGNRLVSSSSSGLPVRVLAPPPLKKREMGLSMI
jgi:hypothetical protein